MDSSLKNIEKEGSSDKVTIKVKVEDEGYHDIVIDWSDGSFPYKDQQVINQLASIIGIPVEYIFMALLIYAPHNHFDLRNIEHRSFDPRLWDIDADDPEVFDEDDNALMPCHFTREKCLGRLNDGDRFVMSTDLYLGSDGCFSLHLWLYSLDCELYNENNCTHHYCHYSSTRTFIDRKVSVATNTELQMILRARYAELPHIVDDASYIENRSQSMRIMRELHINMFIWVRWCSSNNESQWGSPYSRTRG
ncbi:uncharacterized protein LOC107367874 [Tetranychus urticae]|uniref:Uncharacterized protein n=1 Tax=Tetranychus urticae TaxID=32264 RepID=T1KW57_TETUR|nr:uncharacterized protein LOC107367874 [Tetranychus urticae]